MNIRFCFILFCSILFLLIFSQVIFCEEAKKNSQDKSQDKNNNLNTDLDALSVDEIINNIEKKYSGEGFIVDFTQETEIKSMDIKDSAAGRILIKRPNLMRWEYDKPEKQLIITDSKTMWIYKPEDKQVMTGDASNYFGGGKGANFLSDIRLIRKQFEVGLQRTGNPKIYSLKLIPKISKDNKDNKIGDILIIFLSIFKKDFTIKEITTVNSQKDETRIYLVNYGFNQKLDDFLFDFKPPEGVDILKLDSDKN